jgi:hypothetical protein
MKKTRSRKSRDTVPLNPHRRGCVNFPLRTENKSPYLLNSRTFLRCANQVNIHVEMCKIVYCLVHVFMFMFVQGVVWSFYQYRGLLKLLLTWYQRFIFLIHNVCSCVFIDAVVVNLRRTRHQNPLYSRGL